MNYSAEKIELPLPNERGIVIPKDLTQAEADYFAAWFKLWDTFHPKPEALPLEEILEKARVTAR